MKCHQCQTDVDEKSMYCPKCGERLNDVNEPAEPSSEPLISPPTQENSILDGADPPAEQPSSAEPEPSPSPLDRLDSSGELKTVSQRLRDTAKDHHPSADDPETMPDDPWTEGGYSSKALRDRMIGLFLLTGAFVALGIWLRQKEWMPEGWAGIIWGALMAIPLVCWVWFGCIYVYRVWTIKYRLTTYRFFHEEGIFRRVKDVIEVIDIDDIKLERTLWDRIFNGGVGTVTISSTDSTHPDLELRGLEDPERVFASIDEVRRKQRTERGLKSI